MPLSRLERFLQDNPARNRYLEAVVRRLWTEAGRPMYGNVLVLGCNNAHAIGQVRRRFKPRHLVAVDWDRSAVLRVRRQIGPTALVLGDPDAMPFSRATFHHVCAFTVFPQIPDWQAAVAEVGRVLRPGGAFLFDETAEDLFSLLNMPDWINATLGLESREEDERALTRSSFLDAVGQGQLRLTYQRNLLVEGWFEGVAVKEA